MLAQIGSKALIQHVFDRVKNTGYFTDVVVATDHEEIKNVMEAQGARVIMTESSLPSGTDRIISALTQMTVSYDYVVNVQGDEALISKEQLGPLVTLLNGEHEIDIATLCIRNDSESDFNNPNCVKLVKSKFNKVLYFSRSSIPHTRDGSFNSFYQHIGVYAFSKKTIERIPDFLVSELEEKEKLEQLRWMEAGMDIYVSEVNGNLIGVDTKEDLEKVKKLLT